MAIEVLSAKEALALGKLNREKAYPSPKRDAGRLLPFAEVNSKASFRFGQDAKIFTAGSCFARNIERSLRRMNYNVISSDETFYNPFPERVPFQRFNKFTVHSILNEIEWALGEKEMDSEALLCEAKPGLFCDLQTDGDGFSAPLEEMRKFRETYNSKFAAIADADVVMMTLGLVESWFDNQTETHLNRFPGPAAVHSNPDRFSLHVLSYDDIFQALNETYDVIAKHNKDFKMLITVSPVPLDRTFRKDDILVANSYSKSVQRAAVEAFVHDRPVDYFPSYETVTLTDAAYAWSDYDFRHVRGETVDRIMGCVLERYTDLTERQSAQKTKGYTTAYLKSGDLEKAQAALDAHFEKFEIALDLRKLAADIAFRQGNISAAAEHLQKLIEAINVDPEAADSVLDQKSSVALKDASSMLDQCSRLIHEGDISTEQMEKKRALTILESELSQSPDNADLVWLKSYLSRANSPRANSSKSQEKVNLEENAALMRLRALEDGDVEGAEEVVNNALKSLGVSETLNWELAIVYRKADRLDEALELFSKIGLAGGGKAVPAVKHALPLARRLKKYEMAADLAEKVAKAID